MGLWPLMSVIFLASLALPARSGEKPQLLDNERAFADRIRKTCGWNDQGFVTRINEINPDFFASLEAESDPQKVVWDQQRPFWKEIIRRYAEAYEKVQKQANDRREISATKFRTQIQDVFAKRLKLRGGSSVSWEMWMYLPGYVEWILGHISSETELPPTDQELLKTSLASYPFDMNPAAESEKALQGVISDLKKLRQSYLPSRQLFFVPSSIGFFQKKSQALIESLFLSLQIFDVTCFF